MVAFVPLIPWVIGGAVTLAAGEGVRRAGQGIEDAADATTQTANTAAKVVWGIGAFWVAKEFLVPALKPKRSKRRKS